MNVLAVIAIVVMIGLFVSAGLVAAADFYSQLDDNEEDQWD